ncbi:MAG: DNA primase, partial [Deltaproteobacteria bacterium]
NGQMGAAEPASSLVASRKSSKAVKTQVNAGSSGQRSAEPVSIEKPGASPVPPAPAADVEAEIGGHETIIVLGDRRWRIRGFARNLSYEHMRINLLVSHGDHFHVDNLDLYSARQRNVFLKQATEELQIKLEILKRDLGQVLIKLEELQDQQIKKQLEPKDAVVQINDEDRKAALKLLKDENLLDRITADLSTCGLVGEQTNKLVAYLAAVSRKLAKPLAVMVQSSSAAGKSALMDAVLAFCPEEERVQYSAMTGQSLFYMGESDLKHKILAIAEEEGAEKASYALKLLQSEGKLSIASTGKDPKSGRLVTHEYSVEGPAAILLTTTAIDLDEELLNRCIVLAVDESREQTRAIHQMQREDRTLEGLERRFARSDLRKLHQNAQRLLRPLLVVNPYADKLTFLDDTTRTRRDHLKYLGLIDAIALVRQHQREIKTGVVRGRRVDYIEATLSDITMANRLASEALGRTLDELPPQTRRLLYLVAEMVQAECEAKKIDQRDLRFTRRQVRQYTAFGNTQLKVHLRRLTEMEYLLVHRGTRGQSFTYELLYAGEGKNGSRFVLGLLDAEKNDAEKGAYDAKWAGSETGWSGQTEKRSALGRPQAGGRSGGSRSEQESDTTQDNSKNRVKPPKSTYTGNRESRSVVVAAAASCQPGE